ncbi:sensor histidine kinase [Nocardioides sp. AX2bis]|uniref:sensor histidine kinase n=1 Tax=Nocardioides sp. AX2bis TaxID=2653157 RepID=UPI0012F13F3A|nr:HAMP domain-containing sensor histidine kinase [Nocardioides sp. AX2bis]VXC08475.1 Two-component sensor histidine kinase [Nocardioides sp. AX2bis]
MTERRSRPERPTAAGPDTSVVPGRIRIVAWILLATTLGLVAVVLTLRSAALAEVERDANDDVLQEADEFRTFAAEGVDPETGQPVDDAQRLLELHLRRQFPGSDEVLLGIDPRRTGSAALLVQDVPDPVGLVEDPEDTLEHATSEEVSGIDEENGVPYRWGTVRIGDPADPDGVFLVAVSTTEDRAEVDRQMLVVLAVCLGGLLVTAAIAWVAAGAILRPVRDVRRAASRVTRAELGERIPVTGRDDVSALASTFNGMLDRLEQAFTAQSRFAASAGEHLRPALATVRERSGGDPEALEAVARMETILDDLGVLAVAEQAGFVAPRPVRLGSLVDDLRERVRREVGATHEVVATPVADPDRLVVVDPGRVTQALVRLARNAAQESPAGTTVTLDAAVRTADASADQLELALRDQGPGLTPAQARRALDRPSVGPGETTRDGRPAPDEDDDSTAGPGLGLAVVRAVADAHDGSLWLETAPGQGATFGLRLPADGPVDDGPATGGAS